MRLCVMRSPRKSGASSMVQAGIVNSSANTVASGSSSRLDAHRYCAPKWMLLRSDVQARGGGALIVVPQLRAQRHERADDQQARRPRAPTRISMMLSVADSSRIDTAIAENDSSVPVIQRTTRAMGGMTTWVRPRFQAAREGAGRGRSIAGRHRHSASGWFSGRAFSKAGKLGAGGVDGDDLGKGIERHLQAARIGDLRHQADVGERDVGAEGVGSGPQHRLERVETLAAPSGGTRRRSWPGPGRARS